MIDISSARRTTLSVNPRQAKKVAGLALGALARDGYLRRALDELPQLEEDIALASAVDNLTTDVQLGLMKRSHTLSHVNDVLHANTTDTWRVAVYVVQALKQVSEFVRLDGGHLDSNITAVERLISSGRGDLFSR